MKVEQAPDDVDLPLQLELHALDMMLWAAGDYTAFKEIFPGEEKRWRELRKRFGLNIP